MLWSSFIEAPLWVILICYLGRLLKQLWYQKHGCCPGTGLCRIAVKDKFACLIAFSKDSRRVSQIPATALSVILTDKAGRRPLMMVRKLINLLYPLKETTFQDTEPEPNFYLQISSAGMSFCCILLALSFFMQVSWTITMPTPVSWCFEVTLFSPTIFPVAETGT